MANNIMKTGFLVILVGMIFALGVRAKEIDKTEVTIYVLEKHAEEPWN